MLPRWLFEIQKKWCAKRHSLNSILQNTVVKASNKRETSAEESRNEESSLQTLERPRTNYFAFSGTTPKLDCFKANTCLGALTKTPRISSNTNCRRENSWPWTVIVIDLWPEIVPFEKSKFGNFEPDDHTPELVNAYVTMAHREYQMYSGGMGARFAKYEPIWIETDCLRRYIDVCQNFALQEVHIRLGLFAAPKYCTTCCWKLLSAIHLSGPHICWLSNCPSVFHANCHTIKNILTSIDLFGPGSIYLMSTVFLFFKVSYCLSVYGLSCRSLLPILNCFPGRLCGGSSSKMQHSFSYILTCSYVHIFTSSNVHTYACSYCMFSHLHMFLLSDLNIFTTSHLQIFTSFIFF